MRSDVARTRPGKRHGALWRRPVTSRRGVHGRPRMGGVLPAPRQRWVPGDMENLPRAAGITAAPSVLQLALARLTPHPDGYTLEGRCYRSRFAVRQAPVSTLRQSLHLLTTRWDEMERGHRGSM